MKFSQLFTLFSILPNLYQTEALISKLAPVVKDKIIQVFYTYFTLIFQENDGVKTGSENPPNSLNSLIFAVVVNILSRHSLTVSHGLIHST